VFEEGSVTCKDPDELYVVESALDMPLSDVTAKHAGLMPTFEQVPRSACCWFNLQRNACTCATGTASCCCVIGRPVRAGLKRIVLIVYVARMCAANASWVQVEAYALQQGYPANCTFSSVLQHFALEATQDDLYFLCQSEEIQTVAAVLDELPELSLYERYQFSTAPVNARKALIFNAFYTFAERCDGLQQQLFSQQLTPASSLQRCLALR
jgi:hypothetical protein